MGSARTLDRPAPKSHADEEAGSGGVPGSLSGTVLGGFALATFVGRGGMADVYAARPITVVGPAGRVAIKRMLPHLAAKPRLVELFLHEAELACRLVHPNLVRCLDFGTADGVPFMALEFVDGIPCDALQHWLTGRRAFPPRIALAVVHGVLSGLAFAHEAKDERGQSLSIVHLDVSPDNILISREGVVKLADFGVAQSAFALGPAASSELRGKPGYMSPEQIIGAATDSRSDVFSVGVVLAEFLLGQHVFQARDPLDLLIENYSRRSDELGEVRRSAPPAVAELVRIATARDPGERFQSSREFLHALCEAALGVGGLPDGAELAEWLVEEELLPLSSGVFDLAGIAVSTSDLSEKIDEARPTRGPEHGPAPETVRRSPSVSEPPGEQSLRLRSTQGAHVETCSFAGVVERIVTGRAGLDSDVAREDQRFVPLRDITALAFVAKVPAYRFDDGADRRAEWRVSLERARIPSILHDLAVRRVRGVLSLSSGSRRKRVYFDDGRPAFVSSTDPSELLGQRLLALGILQADELDDLVTAATRHGRRLGQALVAARVLPTGSVLRLLVSELERRVLELRHWTEGEVSFTPGERPGVVIPTELAPPSHSACQLVRHVYSDEEVASFLLRNGDGPMTLSPHAEAAASRALLTDFELSVVARATGQAPLGLVERLAATGAARPEQSRRALFLGLSLGLLACPGWLWRH